MLYVYCVTVLPFYTSIHNQLYKVLIDVFVRAFIPLLVFLHGCVQCVYPSSVWQHYLPLGCSICVCHHGPHHLQSQVLAPRMPLHSSLKSVPKGQFCVLNCCLETILNYYVNFHGYDGSTTQQPQLDIKVLF